MALAESELLQGGVVAGVIVMASDALSLTCVR
jgi:hypothetical protein